MATSTDTNYFTDGDELTSFMQDMRAADQITVSSLEDANAIIDDFRNRDVTSPWSSSLDRIDVADRLQELVSNPRLLNQGALNLCGPATFLCIWAGRDPLGFASFATQLYDTGQGQIGSLQISPSQDLLDQDFNEMLTRMSTNPTRARQIGLSSEQFETQLMCFGRVILSNSLQALPGRRKSRTGELQLASMRVCAMRVIG